MTSLRYERLWSLSAEERRSLGTYGYVSREAWRIRREAGDGAIRFRLDRERLAAPFRKTYEDEDEEEMNRRLALGYSVGAYDADRLVGMLVAEPQAWNRTLQIMDFQVADAYRQRGIGGGLLAEAVRLARAGGFRAIGAETQHTNGPAVSFYLSRGFALDGFDLSLYDGLDEAALFFRLHLEPSGLGPAGTDEPSGSD